MIVSCQHIFSLESRRVHAQTCIFMLQTYENIMLSLSCCLITDAQRRALLSSPSSNTHEWKAHRCYSFVYSFLLTFFSDIYIWWGYCFNIETDYNVVGETRFNTNNRWEIHNLISCSNKMLTTQLLFLLAAWMPHPADLAVETFPLSHPIFWFMFFSCCWLWHNHLQNADI